MQPFDLVNRLEHLRVVDPIAAKLSGIVQALPGARLKDALHGVWLGHPLHPAMVTVPIGSFTSAAVLDLLPEDRYGDAADAVIAVGVASAVPTAAAGFVDWADLNTSGQRTGVVHAFANNVSLTCYIASLVARRRGNRGRGRLLALAGLAAVGVGGLIGGHLSYRQGAGANSNADVGDLVDHDWVEVGSLDELPEGRLTVREAGGIGVLLLRRGSRVQALVDRCSHLSGPLHEGSIQGDCVVCPWHGSTFRLADGSVVHGPATSPQPSYDVRVSGGQLAVKLRP